MMQEHGLMTSRYVEFAVKSSRSILKLTSVEAEDAEGIPYGIKSTYIDSIKISEFVGTLQYRILGRRKWT